MIETVEEWNARLGYCGCCPMPKCPTPEMVCESIISTKNCSDDVETPTEEEGETVIVGCFRPFKLDEVNEGDPLPTIYRVYRFPESESTSSGSYASYFLLLMEGTGPDVSEGRVTATWSDANQRWEGTYSLITVGPDAEGARFEFHNSTEPLGDPFTDNRINIVDLPDEFECTSTSRISRTQIRRGSSGDVNAIPNMTGVPGSPPYSNGADVFAYEFESKTEREESLEDPLTQPDLIEAALSGLAEKTWGTTYDCSAALYMYWPVMGEPVECQTSLSTAYLRSLDLSVGGAYVTARKFRFRFRIPYTHTGSKFTITYDVAEFPDDAEVDPFFVSQDNVVEWIGRGDQQDPDSESWLTHWVEIDPPEYPGERRIVNIRYTCYTGTKYGVKPQVMGGAFEPPAP